MIRKAKQTDAKEAAVLLYNALHDIAYKLTGGTTTEDVQNGLHHWFSQPANRLSFENSFVEERDGKAVGLLIAYHGKDATSLDAPILAHLRSLHSRPHFNLDKEAEDDEYYIDTLSVSPAYEGQGIGTALIRAAEEEARTRGYEKIAMLAELINTRALSLYQHRGYVQDQTVFLIGEPFAHLVKVLPKLANRHFVYQ